MNRKSYIVLSFLAIFLMATAAHAQKSPECIQANVDLADGLISKAQRDETCDINIKQDAKKAVQKLEDVKEALKKKFKKNIKKGDHKKPASNESAKVDTSKFVTKEDFKQWLDAFIDKEGDLGKLKAQVDHHHPDPNQAVVLTTAEFEAKQSSLIWTVVIILFISLICFGATAGIAYWLYKLIKENREGDDQRTIDLDHLTALLIQNGTVDQKDL
ncbi:hypothetical protein KKA33_02355 [Patescibacteria group bacterium]|nr:hypothetical protein [Patescibacteria group bacterium]